MEGEFEQIMTKIRWNIKENNNYITAAGKFYLPLFCISYKFWERIDPIRTLSFYWNVLWYYHRAWVVKFETETKGLIFFKTSIPDDIFFETLVMNSSKTFATGYFV